MNICIVSDAYPTKDGKGGFFFVEQLVNQFAHFGHQCIVVAPVNIMSKYFVSKPYGDYYEEKSTIEGNVIKIYRPRYYGRNIVIKGVSLNSRAPMLAFERVMKQIKVDIDVIYCHFFKEGVIAYRYAQKNKIPLFIATGESKIAEIKKPYLGYRIEDMVEYTSGIICVSTKNKNEAVNLGYAKEIKCRVIPNGVDLNLFKPHNKNESRKELSICENDFILICVGNFVERKGQTRIIKALERIDNPNIRLILIGTGEIEDNKNVVLFKGFVNHDSIPKYLSAADCFILPTRWEGCCNSIIEAMACRLPIISSNREFNWDILNDENSILINPDDIEEISKAINYIYNNPIIRERMAIKALADSRKLSIEKRAQYILDFINEKRDKESI